MVFFLGGVTYTEIAALRWVSRQNKGTAIFCSLLSRFDHLVSPPFVVRGLIGRNFLIATTGIISGNGMIDSIAGINATASKEAGL